MKKKKSIGKIVLSFFLVLLLIVAGLVFVAYRSLNNSRQYEDTFFTDETKQYTFLDIVTYNTSTYTAHVEVPRDAFKGFVDDILEDIELPYGLTIERVGLILNDDQTISIIPEVKYKDLITTCPMVNIAYEIKEDRVDFTYQGIYLLNEMLSKLINDNTGLEIGNILKTIDLPSVIKGFHKCPFMVEYIYNLTGNGDTVSCDYDVYHALLELYKTDTTAGEEDPWFQENLLSLEKIAFYGYTVVGE